MLAASLQPRCSSASHSSHRQQKPCASQPQHSSPQPKPSSHRPSRDDSTRLHGRANKLVIWDCDGVLVDSEALLKRAEVDAFKAAGFDDVDEDACNRLFSGFAPEAGAVNFEKEYGKPLPEHFFRDQIANSQQLFRDKLEALNGATVRTLHAAGRQQVVASGSPRDRVDVCLGEG